jgi:predicted aldo/keto reductase-like oxidoreductase
MHDPNPIDRREFLRRSAAAGMALGVSPLAAGAVADPPRVRRKVRLGRTGLEVPDIGFGGSSLAGDEALVRHALDRGITYFDTAEGYKGGRSEETLGRALAGVRDEVTLASKVMAGADESRADIMASLEASLRRLRTDRIDVYFNHAINSVDRIGNPEWAEFVTLARKQGKIRWSGMSGHGGQLAECIDYALDHDLIDVMLVAHNFGQDPSFTQRFTARLDFVAVQPDLPRVMKKAREKDVGVIAMKTLRGARLNDMRPFEEGGATYAQAAFRWVLAGPHVDALIVTMKSPEQVDEYLGASGATRPTNADASLLQRYEARNGATQCRYGCRACADACPEGVPIAEVLRTRMYARDYEDTDLARAEYAALGAAASACVGCAHVSCQGACPFGIAIERHTGPTHRLLGGA